MRNVLIGLVMLMCLTAFSQEEAGTLRLYGRMESNGKMIPDVSIEVIKDNQIIYEGKNEPNGSYKLDLELGAVYNVAFQKMGYITKQVGVIAIHPDKELTETYVFQLDLELLELHSGEEDNTVLPPVAKLYIKDADKGFTYDKQYVKWVATKYEEVEEKTD
jgi:hypothetical protein